MMSANSSLAKFIKEQKEYTYRRLPLAALSIIMYFLYDVFGTVMLISREKAYTFSETLFDVRGAAALSGLMGLRGFHWFIGCVGAVLLAIQGFSYLYKTQTVDFYESRPEKRSTRFINIVVNGLFIYALPSLLGVLLSYLIAAINGCAPSWLFMEMMMAWGYGSVLFLAVYGVSILAALLTGTVVTAVCMNFFLFVIEAWIRLTILGYRAAYYATFDMARMDGLMSNIYTLPPFNYLKGIIESKVYAIYDYDFVATNDYILGLARYCTKGTLINLAIFIVTIILSFIIFKKRKSEFAGKAVISRPLELIVKFAAGILCSLDAGLFIHTIFRNGSSSTVAPVIFTILIMVFLSSIIMESIFAQNMRMAFNKPLHMPVIAAIAIVILFIYKSGITGYDTYLPKEAEVSSAWLLNNNYNADYYDDAEEYLPTSDFGEKNMYLTNIRDVITLAYYSQAEAVKLKDNPVDSTDNVWYSTIGWRMKDGRIVTRSVAIPETIDPALMDSIVGREEFTDGVYHMNDTDWISEQIESSDIKRKFTFSTSTEHGIVETKKNIMTGFMEAYKNDVRDHYDFTLASTENPVGCFNIYDNRYFSMSWPIYENYAETIEFLKANDLWAGGFLLPSEIEKIEVSKEVYDDAGEYEETTKEYTSESDIKRLMDASISTSFYSAWMKYGSMDDSNYYMIVYPKTQSADDLNYETNYSRSFYKGKLPTELLP